VVFELVVAVDEAEDADVHDADATVTSSSTRTHSPRDKGTNPPLDRFQPPP